jgi:hypothetical protein
MYLKIETNISFSLNSLGTGQTLLLNGEHLFCNYATEGYWNRIVSHRSLMWICYTIQRARPRILFDFKFHSLWAYKTNLQHGHHFCCGKWMYRRILMIRRNRVLNYRYKNNGTICMTWALFCMICLFVYFWIVIPKQRTWDYPQC